MATVKIKYSESVLDLFDYARRGRESDDPIDFVDCTEGTLVSFFESCQKRMPRKSPNEAIHIIQSWSEEESRRYDPWVLNEIGKEMVERLYPGHAAAIVTHTDTGKTHNHIVLNPVHSFDNRRITNQKKRLYDLRNKNDEVNKEKGLSVIKEHSREAWDKMSDEVRAINKRQGFSKIADIKEKANFSMSVATSFDEYSTYMNRFFGIKVKIRGTSVSYLYPNMSKFKRGKNLGKKYTFDGLVERFKQNDENFVSVGLKTFDDIRGKDYSAFHNFRKTERNFVIPDRKLNKAILNPKLIKSLKEKSILDYCESNGISIHESEVGRVLSGREYIKLSEKDWKNEKTNTVGGVLEFVSNHRKVDFLESIGILNDEIDVQKLKQVVKPTNQSFRSFYVPDQGLLSEKDQKVADFSLKHGFNRNILFELSKSGKASIHSDSRIKLFPRASSLQSMTYYHEKDQWVSRKLYGLKENLMTRKGVSKNLVIFDSPFTFFKSKRGHQLFKNKSNEDNFVVPFKPIRMWVKENIDLLGQFSRVSIVRDESRSVLDEILSFKKSETKTKVTLMSVNEFDEFLKREMSRGKQK